MNQKSKDVFKGKVVNKALTTIPAWTTSRPYVVDYLIDTYCSEETFHNLAALELAPELTPVFWSAGRSTALAAVRGQQGSGFMEAFVLSVGSRSR